MPDLLTSLQDAVRELSEHPHGIPATNETRTQAGEACVKLCHGNQDEARTLWKLITAELGYMPLAAAVALIQAAKGNLVPDVQVPDLEGGLLP